MVAISPWTRGGWVSSEVSDHTSALRFLERWTAAIGKPATCPNISAWRRKVCGDFTGMLDLANPAYGLPALPDTSATIGESGCSNAPAPAPADNRLPQQEAGTRPARALPYQPNANLDHLDFGSNGNGSYDLSVIGPNRFLRRFKGDATKPGKSVTVTVPYAVAPDTGKQAVWFNFANTGTALVTFTITSNAYRSDGPWTYQVSAGGTDEDYFNAVYHANGWYDFTVTVITDTTWSQRFTGHLETGLNSISG